LAHHFRVNYPLEDFLYGSLDLDRGFGCQFHDSDGFYVPDLRLTDGYEVNKVNPDAGGNSWLLSFQYFWVYLQETIHCTNVRTSGKGQWISDLSGTKVRE